MKESNENNDKGQSDENNRSVVMCAKCEMLYGEPRCQDCIQANRFKNRNNRNS